jgi:Holliday junction resolvasome RuvABC DNA-binding subunit
VTDSLIAGTPSSVDALPNVHEAFGFPNELSFFELLLDVSGIGPKSALAITAISSIENLQRAIASGDTSYLNKVSGIGKKTAEKIVIELRDKLKDFKCDEETEEQSINKAIWERRQGTQAVSPSR